MNYTTPNPRFSPNTHPHRIVQPAGCHSICLASALQRRRVRLERVPDAHKLRQIQQLVRLDTIGQRVDAHAANAHGGLPQQLDAIAVLAHDKHQPLAGGVLAAQRPAVDDIISNQPESLFEFHHTYSAFSSASERQKSS